MKKVYLVKHKNTANNIMNLVAFSDTVAIKHGFYVKSVKAFLRKKYAQEFIDSMPESVKEFREIIVADLS